MERESVPGSLMDLYKLSAWDVGWLGTTWTGKSCPLRNLKVGFVMTIGRDGDFEPRLCVTLNRGLNGDRCFENL